MVWGSLGELVVEVSAEGAVVWAGFFVFFVKFDVQGRGVDILCLVIGFVHQRR